MTIKTFLIVFILGIIVYEIIAIPFNIKKKKKEDKEKKGENENEIHSKNEE